MRGNVARSGCFVVGCWSMYQSVVGEFEASNRRNLPVVHALAEVELAALRSNAVAVGDGFDFHDRVLGSTLGCYDGRVYERLMAKAKKSPLNQEPVNASFRTHLQPFMRGKL